MIWLLVLAVGALGEHVSTASPSGAGMTPTTLSDALMVQSLPTVSSFVSTEPPPAGRAPTESRGENFRRVPPFRDPAKTSGGRAAGPEPLGPNSGSLHVDLMMESHNLTETPSSTTATQSGSLGAASLLERKLAMALNSSDDMAGNSVCNISLQCPTCTSWTENLGDLQDWPGRAHAACLRARD